MPGTEHDAVEPDEEEDDERPRHPYTWLHLIVLAVVAFVLGFLIVLLYTKASGEATASGSTVVTVSAARAGPSA
ncbi:hypothetical protein CBP52_07390 [Cellulomonas sp. PSBB021]|nr:hypothetical protein CBP52_07390 [Cellulomonas sp. PSBB021]